MAPKPEEKPQPKDDGLVEVTVAKGHTISSASVQEVVMGGKPGTVAIAKSYGPGKTLRIPLDEAIDLIARGIVVDPDADEEPAVPVSGAVIIDNGVRHGPSVTTAG